MAAWVPSDGDTLVTREEFIFSVFGYEHPRERVFAFLKYIPAKHRDLFNVAFLERTWKYGRVKLFRAEKLYTAQNYQTLLRALQNRFPSYVYYCPFREKDVISTPLTSVKKVYIPRQCLHSLMKQKKRDNLQEMTLSFVDLLSSESGIDYEDLGVHGSVALDMHTSKSDIDLVVYGAENFRKLEKTVDRLVKAETLSYQSNNRLDTARRFKGKYQKKTFMYTAIRKSEEVKVKYGMFKFSPIATLKFRCTVKDDREAMFRPATYEIENYKAANAESELGKDRIPRLLVSMIGCYRNVARKGDVIRVSGMLERVENVETKEVFHQVVVGTGTNEDEIICPA